MRWNDTEPLPELDKEFFLRVALEGNTPPPASFVEAVMLNRITISAATMEKLVERGWLPRQRCEIWSRVMGYFRPVSHFNPGKKAEFAERTRIDPRKIDPGD